MYKTVGMEMIFTEKQALYQYQKQSLVGEAMV